MARWHRIESNAIIDTVECQKPPKDIALDGNGDPIWRIEERQTIDSSVTEYKNTVTDTTIEPTRVLVTTTITDKSPAEIDVVKTARATQMIEQPYGQMDKLQLGVLFWLAKQHQPSLTFDQFMTNATTFVADVDDALFEAKVKEYLP